MLVTVKHSRRNRFSETSTYVRVSALLEPLPVVHFLEAFTSAGEGLWGKERLIESLMLAQRESGSVAPSMVVFESSSIVDVMRGHGFEVDVLETHHRRLPTHSLPTFLRTLRRRPRAVVHTHEFKANVVGRVARLAGAPMLGLVATCHGWTDENIAVRFYNELDRQTAFLSDITTAPDAKMLARFPKRGRRLPVTNALPGVEPPSPQQRAEARSRFEFPSDRTVIGFLARTSVPKGILELLEAARLTVDEPVLWAIAGAGELDGHIAKLALPNVRPFGYIAEAGGFRAALDAFVQASHREGLSLSLLEAMRDGLPIIATDVGSTTLAVRDGIEARIVPPCNAQALAAAARAFVRDPVSAGRLGVAAQQRFSQAFQIDRQHRDFLRIYRSCLRQ